MTGTRETQSISPIFEFEGKFSTLEIILKTSCRNLANCTKRFSSLKTDFRKFTLSSVEDIGRVDRIKVGWGFWMNFSLCGKKDGHSNTMCHS